MFKKILFDLDGTLTDSKIGITKSVQLALKHFGIEEETDNLTKFIGPPLKDSFMEFYGFNEEQANEGIKIYRERFSSTGIFENEVYDGIPEMLSMLKQNGIILAVASSKPEVFVEQILEHFDLREYFDVVVGSLLNGMRMKKEEVIEEALKNLGVEVNTGKRVLYKDEIAMVGDRKFDVCSANLYGLTSVGVKFGFAEPMELEKSNADYIAENVNDLCEYLLK